MVAGQESAWDTRVMEETMTPLRATVCTGTPSKGMYSLAAIDVVLSALPVHSIASCLPLP